MDYKQLIAFIVLSNARTNRHGDQCLIPLICLLYFHKNKPILIVTYYINQQQLFNTNIKLLFFSKKP